MAQSVKAGAIQRVARIGCVVNTLQARGEAKIPVDSSIERRQKSIHNAQTGDWISMTKPDKLMNKIALSLFALCYVVMYTYGGITNGVLPMYKQFSGCWKAGSFVPVSAMVVSADLESHYSSDAATTYRVLAKFSYDYQGSNHIGQRIRLDDGDYDSIRSYHEDINEQLSKARNSLSPVTLWVNPRKPDEAVYDRSLRWMLVASVLPFVVLHLAVGLGAGWGLWRIWRKNDTTSNLVESAFKHSQTAFTSNRYQVVQGDGGGLIGLSIGCAFWNILSWPLAIMYFSSAIATSWWLLILPAIGLLLLFNVLQTICTQRRIGKSVLILKGLCLPGSIPLRGNIRFNPALGTSLAFPRLTHDVKVTVEC